MSEPESTVALLDAARRDLRELPRERIGERAATRRVLGLGRAPRIVPVAAAWRVGVLLLTDDRVFQVGTVLRARQDAIRGYTATSQRLRSEDAAAARRGGFAEGETVNLDVTELDPVAVDDGGASGPLSLVGGVPHIRWSAAGATRRLDEYLREQLSLRRA